MKKIFTLFLSLLLTTLVATNVFAYDEDEDEYTSSTDINLLIEASTNDKKDDKKDDKPQTEDHYVEAKCEDGFMFKDGKCIYKVVNTSTH